MDKSIFLREAERIGETLMDALVADENGLHWKTWDLNGASASWKAKSNIYDGNAGILLFIDALYKIVPKEAYRQAIKDVTGWLKHQIAASDSPVPESFYCGDVGIAYALIVCGNTIGDASLVDDGVRYACKCAEKVISSTRKNKYDLLLGLAGGAAGLLNIYKETKNTEILQYLKEYTTLLVAGAKPDRNGIYFDIEKTAIRPLTGLSHGAGGVALVLLELSFFFGSSFLEQLAFDTFSYENSLFRKDISNWPDLRKGIHNQQDLDFYKSVIRNPDIPANDIISDSVVWCHGAPGIGLTRIKAYHLTRHKRFMADIRAAANKISMLQTNIDKDSFCLCHGHGGNSVFHLEHFRYFGDHTYWELAKSKAVACIQAKETLGYYKSGIFDNSDTEDLSLFTGIAGIGYFMLQVHDPLHTKSCLLPVMQEGLSNTPVADESFREALHAAFIKAMLPGCYSYLSREGNNPGSLFAAYCNNHAGTTIVKGVIKWINELLVSQQDDSMLIDWIRIDKALLKVRTENNETYRTIAMESIQADYYHQLNQLSWEMLQREELITSKDIKRVSGKIDIHLTDSGYTGGSIQTQKNSYVLRKRADGVHVAKLSTLADVLMKEFRFPNTIHQVVRKILGDEYENNQVHLSLLCKQIIELSGAGYLLPVADLGQDKISC